MVNDLKIINIKVWFLACLAMTIHSFFDVLRDGYFYSPEIKKLIIIDWHVIKVIAGLFLVVSAILIWQYMRKHWEFVIGILIVRWGACEYFWNILDKHYAHNTKFMGLSAWIAGGFAIAGILLPLVSQSYYIKIIQKWSDINRST